VITLETDCGIDVEKIMVRHNPKGVAKKIFADAELKQLGQLEGREFLERFFSYWTLREAYCKARGIPLLHVEGDFFFNLCNDGSVRIQFDGDSDHAGDHWQFVLEQPTPNHIAAIALHGTESSGKEVICRMTTP